MRALFNIKAQREAVIERHGADESARRSGDLPRMSNHTGGGNAWAK